MVKVCHVTTVHPNRDVRIFHKQCASLAGNGYDTHLVAPGESAVENNVKVTGFRPARSRTDRFLRAAGAAYRAALKIDADIYHMHDPDLIPYGLKLKKKGKTVVFDCHEDIFVYIPDKQWIYRIVRPVVNFFAVRYFRWALKKIDAVVSVTPHVQRKFDAVAKRNILLTNYPVCDEKLPPHPENKGKTMCYTGTFGSRNIETILQALGRFPDMEFIMAGKATEEYIDSLKAYEGWKNTKYLGLIPHSDVKDVYAASDIGFMVLDYYANIGYKEGSLGAVKLFEYMMAGIPVICSDQKVYKEIVEGYRCGICIPPRDLEKMREAIEYLSTHLDEAAQMGRNGQKAVQEAYNWGTQEKKLLQLYRDLIGLKERKEGMA